MKPTEQLIKMIPQLEAVEFMGLARLLKVKLVTEKDLNAEKLEDKYEPREFTDVFAEMLEKFEKLNRARKREILKLIKVASSKEKVKKNAGNSEDSEAADAS